MDKRNKMTMLNYIAVLSIFLFSGAGTFMNAAVQTMIDAWPNVPVSTVRMVVSLPPLIALPVILYVGTAVGNKLSYRFCAIVGTASVVVAGVAPYFFYSNWGLVLAFRALLGAGVGLLGIRNSLVLASVPEDKRASYIGYGTVLFNGSAMLANLVVGVLADYSWRHPFLFDGLAIIPLVIMIFFLKEPEKVDRTSKKGNAAGTTVEAGKERTSWRIYYYYAMQVVTTAALYPLLSGLSTYIAGNKIGSVLVVGTILAVYQLAGALSNMVLNPIQKFFKQYTIGVMCILVAVGTALILFVPKIPVIFVGAALAGIGWNIMVSMFQVYNGQVASPQKMAFSSTVLVAMMRLGIFASTYFLTVCHSVFHRSTDAESAFIGCLIIYVILTVIAFVCKVAPEKYYSQKTNS